MSWRHIEDTRPIARKEHGCYLCEKTIPIGQRYVRRIGVGKDGPELFTMHEACESLMMEWDQDDWLYHEAAEFAHYEGDTTWI